MKTPSKYPVPHEAMTSQAYTDHEEYFMCFVMKERSAEAWELLREIQEGLNGKPQPTIWEQSVKQRIINLVK